MSILSDGVAGYLKSHKWQSLRGICGDHSSLVSHHRDGSISIHSKTNSRRQSHLRSKNSLAKDVSYNLIYFYLLQAFLRCCEEKCITLLTSIHLFQILFIYISTLLLSFKYLTQFYQVIHGSIQSLF